MLSLLSLHSVGFHPLRCKASGRADKLEEEIDELAEIRWTSVRTIGMGRERRAVTRHQSHVTALWLDDVAIHVNLVSRE